MRWKISLVIAALLASMAGTALYYRALYSDKQEEEKNEERILLSDCSGTLILAT